ncbi:hypothetical protein ACWEWG_29660 [Streptomyces sp. NPDC003758]
MRLHRHPDSQVLDRIATHPDDHRRAVIESCIADRPAAVRFADPTASTITARVRAVTSAAAAEGRVPPGRRSVVGPGRPRGRADPDAAYGTGPDRRPSVGELPGASDGCKGTPRTFSASYAYGLAR